MVNKEIELSSEQGKSDFYIKHGDTGQSIVIKATDITGDPIVFTDDFRGTIKLDTNYGVPVIIDAVPVSIGELKVDISKEDYKLLYPGSYPLEIAVSLADKVGVYNANGDIILHIIPSLYSQIQGGIR